MTLLDIGAFLAGWTMPLLFSAIVPPRYERAGGLLTAVIAIIYLLRLQPEWFEVGLGFGFSLASVKLIARLRWL